MPLTSRNTKTSAIANDEKDRPAGRARLAVATMTRHAPEQRPRARGGSVFTRFQSGPARSPGAACVARASAERLRQDQGDVDDRRAQDHAERDDEADLAERIALAWSQPIATKYGISDQPSTPPMIAGDADARADDHAGAEGRGGQLDGAERRDLRRRDAADRCPRAMPPPSLRDRAAAGASGRSARAGCSRPRAPTGTSSCMRSTRIGV